MTHNAAQPIPDTEGEWRVEAMPTHGWRVVDATGQEIVADVYREEDAAQIISDHKAAKSQALLVEALRDITARAQFALTTPGFIRGRDELQKAVDAALKAAGVAE
jgi:hypothetical protein